MTRARTTTGILVPALLALLLGWSGVGRAQQSQLYFQAKVDAVQSISGTAAGPLAVYLRWGVVSGQLPDDLASFALLRGPVGGPFAVIATLPLEPPSAAEIAALYAPADQSRRLAALQAWLVEEEPGLSPASYATALAARLHSDTGVFAWREIGARMDFNIARAIGMGYRDDGASPGLVEYELVGVRDDASRFRLGHLILDTTAAQVMPAPVGFEAVRLGRCDDPGRAKDHGAIALNWDHPGAKLDHMRNSLLIAGYDVYCSELPAAAVDPTLELREAAANLTHDSTGQITFTGLEKVNQRPIAISGSADTLDVKPGWNEAYAQLLLDEEQTEALGMEPGETYACYAVAYDQSGNYGETARTLVTIPDLDTPATPWSVEVVTDTPGQRVLLEFDHVDQRGYHRDHQDGRVYCNLGTASIDGELRFVAPGQSCAHDEPQRVPSEIDRYVVYRFEDYDEARLFQDSDGDGVADRFEQVLAPDLGQNPPAAGAAVCSAIPAGESCHTLEGSACDPLAQPALPAPAVAFDFAPEANMVVRGSGRRVIEVADALPAAEPGKVYWYRVASQANGNLSPLSAPVRAMFPDRTRPERDEFLQCKLSFGEERCAASVLVSETLDEIFAHDATSQSQASFARVGCFDTGLAQRFDRILELDPLTRSADLSEAECAEIQQECAGGTGTIQYLAPTSEILAAAEFTPDNCWHTSTTLEENCSLSSPRPVGPGDQASGPVRLECLSPDYCVKIYREIGGEDARLATICSDQMPVCFDGYLVDEGGQLTNASCDPDETRVGLPNLGGEDICLSVALVNENNISSSKLHLPCFRSAAPPPGIPSPIDVSFPGADDEALLAWLPPEAPVVGSLLEVSVRGVGYQERFFVEHAGASANEGPLSHLVTLSGDAPLPEANAEDEWCFRARSVGAADPARLDRALSDWSPERCAVRTPSGTIVPEYLGWPKIPVPDQGDPLEGRYLAGDGVPVIRLSEAPTCFGVSIGSPHFPNGLDAPITLHGGSTLCGVATCHEHANGLAPLLSFVPYRQERSGAGEDGGAFIQVGPSVESMHCAGNSVRDPLIKVAGFQPADPWAGQNFLFVDRFPHVPGREYRYEFVYFSAQGEVMGHRRSEWVEVP